VVYEGAFESNTLIAGKSIDGSPENQRWKPERIIVMDASHIRLESGGPVFTKATAKDTAVFNMLQRMSLERLPVTPFDLNGTWSFKNGLKISVTQNNGEITLVTDREGPMFKGRYLSNPTIGGEGMREETPGTLKWGGTTLTVADPDHLRYQGRIVFRFSNPPSRDIACDDKNTNHVQDYYAVLRGTMAVKEQDYKTGTCWLRIGADWGYAPAQSMLAGLLVAAKNPDYATAFDLAAKSAEQGDVDGQKLLAKLYREGRGTQADPEKAQFWEKRASDAKSAAMIMGVMTPGNLLAAIGSFWGMFGGLVDLDLNMTPPNCFSRDVLGNRVPCR
jgi:hypothetical protein